MDLEPVRQWLSRADTNDCLAVHRLRTQRLFDTYLDTADWRIYRGGYAMRIRRGARRPQATLKSLHSAQADVADRLELNEPLKTATIAAVQQACGPVASQIRMLTGTGSLRALFEVRTTRQRFALRRSPTGSALGQVALDDTQICASQGAACTRLRRVEIEALTSEHAVLREFVAVLQRACALQPASDTKFSAGLQVAGLQPPPIAS